jgi:hypothetical protein
MPTSSSSTNGPRRTWSPISAGCGRGAAFTLLLHDTHHRAVSAPHELDAFDLDGYDGVLAFGAVLAETYRRRGWAEAVHVWHEAADARLFRPAGGRAQATSSGSATGATASGRRSWPPTCSSPPGRSASGTVHGVRYPPEARAAVAAAGSTSAAGSRIRGCRRSSRATG